MAPPLMSLLTGPCLLRGLLGTALLLAACAFPKPAVAQLLAAKLDAKMVASLSDPPGADTAHLFEAPGGGWSGTLSEDLELTPIDPPSSLFGSVGLDGDHLVVGAAGDDDVGSFAGSAYFYTLPEPGRVPGILAGWMLLQLLLRRRRSLPLEEIAARSRRTGRPPGGRR